MVIVNFLASHPSIESKHLNSMRTAMSGAAPISNSDVERFMQK